MKRRSKKASSRDNQLDLVDPDNKKLEKDSLQLLQIFSVEVWSMITDHIYDSDDITNIFNSSLFFRHLYSPKQTQFLFPKVWQILESKYHEECTKEYVSTYSEPVRNAINDTDPTNDFLTSNMIIPYGTQCGAHCSRSIYPREYSGILKLRLICKTWSTLIDNFYRNAHHHFKLREDDEAQISHWTTNYFHDYDFIDPPDFEGHFSSTHYTDERERSPFPSRSCHLVFHDDSSLNPFGSNIKRALEQFGNHIWFVKITFDSNEEEDEVTSQFTDSVYSELKEWLDLMPNSKTLKIEYFSNSKANLASEEYEDLQLEVNQNRMPVLENLKCLRASNLPGIVFNALIKMNNHLSVLEVERNSTDKYSEFWKMEMPNLEELSIKIFNETEFKLFVASKVKWPLRKLYLKFEKDLYISWSRIFNLLNTKWANTLNMLALNLPKEKNVKDEQAILKSIKAMKLILPNLKKLKVTLSNMASLKCLLPSDMSSLDFLLPTEESLEFLEILVDCDLEQVEGEGASGDTEKQQDVQFVGYRKCLHQSKFWEIFPKLKRITISQNVYGSAGVRFPNDQVFNSSWIYTREKGKSEINLETKFSLK